MRGFSTEVAPQQILVMEQEVKALLEKGAIEYVPHSNRETGFYSRYFIVPKKDGGLHSILDLRNLNDCVMQLKLKMLTLRKIVPQIRFEDWFVTIDLKDAYFQISITPHFHEMHRCSPGASSALGYSYYELHRRLVDSSSVASVGSAASGCRAGSHERVGITAKRQKECAFSTTEDHFPWHGMGLNVDSGAPVTGT